MMVELNKAARNEQRKITATYINGIAVAFAAIGTLTPLLLVVQQMAAGGTNLNWAPFVIIPVCVLGSLGLHLLARQQLEGMEE
jgi:hypothetical protein